MKSLLRVPTLIVGVLCILAYVSATLAQQPKNVKEATGSIAGRVTLDAKPVANIAVLLITEQMGRPQGLVVKATTGEDGGFELTRVPAGRYRVLAFAPAFIGKDDARGAETGKTIILDDGETVEGINIALARGGVITGRVTDSSGSPLVEEPVILSRAAEGNREQEVYFSSISQSEHVTDDRGVYRLYGLPAGRYRVSVGLKAGGERGIAYGGNTSHMRTYHPGVTDEAQATVLEVEPGGEVTNADIIVGRRMKMFTATGRIVDAETGRPVRDLPLMLGKLEQESKRVSGYMSNGSVSGANGEFRMEGLLPGQYAAAIRQAEPGDYYCEPAIFSVVDADVKGIEVKVRRGSTISGVVVLEEEAGAKDKQKPADLFISVHVRDRLMTVGGNWARVAPDGSFRLGGVPPGRIDFSLAEQPRWRPYPILKIERDGVEQREGVEITQGEHISNLRVFSTAGGGTLRGIVKTEEGPLPENSRVFVGIMNKADDNRRMGFHVDVDERGRFISQDLPAGEYEVTASIGIPSNTPDSFNVTGTTTRTATVTNGAETTLTIVIKLEPPRRPRQ